MDACFLKRTPNRVIGLRQASLCEPLDTRLPKILFAARSPQEYDGEGGGD